ncbi:MAG: phosphatidylserine decarboxylase [Bacilli bacterium]|nr:phosphatidylserine decarboxylase [Bacilli bacterium]
METIVRNRNSKENIIIESNKALNFFYGNFIGRLFIKIAISKPITNLIGKYMNSKSSIKKIDKFIKENNINMYDYENKEYTSYNDFFTRKIKEVKRPINARKGILISPCDSKLLAYKITKDLTLKIKESYYSIDTLVDKKIMKEYTDGYALVFRLSTDNYHRYCYIDSGTKSDNYYIKGTFHTVQPISLKHYNFFKTNSREYTILNTNNFGKVIDIDIGALGVGRIKNHHKEYSFFKGEEKGYFEFGGSTIVLLFKKDTIILDDDIVNNSKENIETIVKYGERIGIKNNLQK